ncbi:Protein of unknown function [Pyronema omphalodes CBS 100304]|nr:Protein of unknown function [Pyronema omphalodes CBS 100304]
MSSEAI